MTVAEQIAGQMGNDGQIYEIDGRSLDEIAREHGADVTTADQEDIAKPGGPSPDATRYKFADGSAIVDLGTGWDIEGSFPWSWAGCEIPENDWDDWGEMERNSQQCCADAHWE